MRDVFEVMREKEQAVEGIVRDIQVLRLAAGLLHDDSDPMAQLIEAPSAREATGPQNVPLGRLVGATATAARSQSPGGMEVAETIKAGAKKISRRLRRLATPLLDAGQAVS